MPCVRDDSSLVRVRLQTEYRPSCFITLIRTKARSTTKYLATKVVTYDVVSVAAVQLRITRCIYARKKNLCVWFVRSADLYYECVNAINCTAENVSNSLLLARGAADADMFLCSLGPCKNSFSLLDTFSIRFVSRNIAVVYFVNSWCKFLLLLLLREQ